MYLQPKVSFDSREMVGMEALVRYRMPDGGILAPDQFLPLLEDAKLISALDFYVFEFACSKVSSWISKGKKRCRFLSISPAIR